MSGWAVSYNWTLPDTAFIFLSLSQSQLSISPIFLSRSQVSQLISSNKRSSILTVRRDNLPLCWQFPQYSTIMCVCVSITKLRALWMQRVDSRPLLKICRLPTVLCLQTVARVGEERKAVLSARSVHQQRTAASAQESSARDQQRRPIVALRDRSHRFCCALPLLYCDILGTSFWLSGHQVS